MALPVGCAVTPQEQANSSISVARTGVVEPVSDVEGEFQAALQLMRGEDWQRAADKLAAITATDPRLSGPWTNLGIARGKIGDTAGSEQAFRKAIETNSSQVAAYNELGILLRRSGRYEEAAAMYHQGLQVNPNAEVIHWNLGILYDRYLPDPRQALLHYERYQQLTPPEEGQLLTWISELREQVNLINVASGAKQ
jgi:Flp pilus assembly protein TadD